MLERIVTLIVAAGCALAALASTAAEPAPRYNSVELQAEAQREVQNDLLNATLFVELSDASPSALANAVNKSVNDALRIAKEYKNVRVRSGNNQTYPVYAKAGLLQGWRGRAEIRIESRDFEAASALIGKLQVNMQLGNLTFSVSPEARRGVRQEHAASLVAALEGWLRENRARLSAKTPMAGAMDYQVPPQDLALNLSRVPTLPPSGFVLTGVRRAG